MLTNLLKKIKKYLSLSNSPIGFTLVELLIVIVIIGVLAGVLIAVVNPQEQINKARDATVRAALNKIALSIKGNVSAYNRVPDGAGVIAGLQNVTASGAVVVNGNCGVGGASCNFTIAGSTLPVNCTVATPYQGHVTAGGAQCVYRFFTPDITLTEFRLAAKSWGSSYVFVYHSSSGGVLGSFERTYICPSSYTDAADPAATCTLTQ